MFRRNLLLEFLALPLKMAAVYSGITPAHTYQPARHHISEEKSLQVFFCKHHIPEDTIMRVFSFILEYFHNTPFFKMSTMSILLCGVFFSNKT
jgi:hypothetical protein